MKNQIALSCMLLSVNAFAGTSMICEPYKSNDYFTENVDLKVVSAKTIKVNLVELALDDTYRPRTQTAYNRFAGDTSKASEWADSGDVQIFFDGKSHLKFTVRGETFISETFTCK